MKNSKFTVLCSLILAVMLAGCSSKKATPQDTVSSAMGSRADWVNQGDNYYSEGLEQRDGDVLGGHHGNPDFGSVHFDFDRSDIKPTERQKVEAAANHLKNNANESILIEGTCDWYGTPEYNLALGERRANAIQSYLQQLGISSDRIKTASLGDSRATPGLSKEAAYVDRRGDMYKMSGK